MTSPGPVDGLALGHVPGLHPYTPGLQPSGPGWVKLNTNECPYPPSPRVADAVRAELGADGASLRLYPEPRSAALRGAIARMHGLSPENVCVGNGSDDILNLIARCFCGPGAAATFTQPGYSLYPVLLGIQDAAAEAVPLDRSMKLPVGKFSASKARALFLTSPNAPTGAGFPTSDIERILSGFGGVTIVDEAYAPFARENAAGLVASYPRLVVVRTLSKAFALAGIRVGYALGHPGTVALLDRVRDSYNVSRLSQAAALAALTDGSYYTGVIDKIVKTRDLYISRFRARGWFTFPSQANFICTEPKDANGRTGVAVAKSAYDHLFSRKVLVRHFPSDALTGSCLRISVGTDDEMHVLDQTLEAWQKAPPTA